MARSGRSGRSGTRARSAISGRFVTKAHAARSGRTTVLETHQLLAVVRRPGTLGDLGALRHDEARPAEPGDDSDRKLEARVGQGRDGPPRVATRRAGCR